MKKQLIIVTALLCIVSLVQAQDSGDFAVPLSDPNKRGKLKAHLNYGSITVKGTARKDVMVKYSSVEDDGDHQNEPQGVHDARNHYIPHGCLIGKRQTELAVQDIFQPK